MAFQGDFDRLDDEIKCQLRAIKNNDFETIKKIHASELTQDAIKKYIQKDDRDKGKISYDDDNAMYDSDLEKTMYQEFWQELREFNKPKEDKDKIQYEIN